MSWAVVAWFFARGLTFNNSFERQDPLHRRGDSEFERSIALKPLRSPFDKSVINGLGDAGEH